MKFQIHVVPLEDLTKHKGQNVKNYTHDVAAHSKDEAQNSLTDEPSETFSRALKRKFTELDEITQRLRLRLSKVMEDDSDASSDGVADQFEKDINTLSIEEDFDLVNFEDGAEGLNIENPKEDKISESNLLMTNALEELINGNKMGIESSKSNSSQSGSGKSSSVDTLNNSKYLYKKNY